MDQDSLLSVFERLRRRLLRRAADVVMTSDEADDTIQDAFCRLWPRREAIGSESHAEALITTTVTNLAIDSRRRARTRATMPLQDNDAVAGQYDPPDDDSGERFREVEALLARHVGERDRMIFYRRERDDWGFDDIARESGVSEGNARLIVSRVRKTVRTLYQKYYGGK